MNFLAPDFRIRFGNDPDRAADTDTVHGPQGLVDLVTDFRAATPGLRYAVDGTTLVDPGLGRVSSCW
ncbi:hypothetical protein ABZV31_01400 [Streptomyces sp. NPDC005202]|uniref:hypothetical protein n=1 Tax=Streptomyces sp. NPDC005202 TaxID=3157021 RepID=UPI0033B1819A